MSLLVPASHLDLLAQPIYAVFTTMMPSGQPHSSLVWCDYDGACACVNLTRECQHGQNMRSNPKVSLLAVDPQDTSRYIEIRGEAELVTDGALAHLDALAQRYTHHPRYYGFVRPLAHRAHATHMICRIHTSRITLDAIHR